MQLTQGLRRNMALYRERAATICEDRVQNWETLLARVERLAGGLIALGAREDDRIAILDLNSDHYIEAFYAIAWAGCVSVPFNTRWAPAEIDHALNDASPKIVFLGASFASHRERFEKAGTFVIMIDDASFNHLVDGNDPVEDRSGAGDSLAAIFYTGGTTGRSKGVMLSHVNLLSDFFLVQAVFPHDPDTVYLHTPPMFHLADAAKIFGLTMLGATHVVLPGFEPEATINAIEKYQITDLVLVPTMIGMLCEALRRRPADVSSVRNLIYGASPISSALLETAMRALPNAKFCQAYGQTELSPGATVLDHADHLAGRLRSAGRAIPCVDVRTVDEDMRSLPTGEVGEVVVRGPNVMLGYWQQPELTAKTIIDGWLKTGDAGYIDPDGYLYLVDRVKDMIVSGGENVYSSEVENALLSHKDVLQCAVIGVPDDRWGERVHAVLFVRAESLASEEDFVTHCQPLIANYKRPKSFDIRKEPLPLSGVGKILKTELRKPFWEGAGRSIG
jgi:long-chain acyl-CoA synthetase